LIRILF
jgi:hypothetical protein